MEMETIAQLLIYIHAGFGGVALLAGAVALVAKKGQNLHKKSGKVFFYAMLISAGISLVVAVLPHHESPFLFSIGLFSTYLLLSGYRSLRFKRPAFDLKTDKVLAYAMLGTGISMVLIPLILSGQPNIVLPVFGVAGCVFGFRDLRLFQNLKQLKQRWLKLHVAKMTGGYIAAVTAFFVVNQILPGIWNWFVPGIIGSGYISFWLMKLNKKKPVAKTVKA